MIEWVDVNLITKYITYLVIRLTSTHSISTYPHISCVLDSSLWGGVLDTTLLYVIKFVVSLKYD